MRGGALRKRIEIQQCIFGRDAAGGPVENWVPFSTAWAEVQDLTGRETTASQQLSATLTDQFTIRFPGRMYMPDEAMRVVFQKKFYNVVSVVDPDQAHRELVLMTERRPANRVT